MTRSFVIIVFFVAFCFPTHAARVCAQYHFYSLFENNEAENRKDEGKDSTRWQLQTDYSWADFVEEYQQYVLEEGSEDDYAVTRYDWLDELEEIHEHPFNINTADKADLQQLHFLSDEQVDSLLSRREHYHGFRSLGELMTVRQLDYQERAWLSLFVTFGSYPEVLNDSVKTGVLHTPYTPEEEVNRWFGGNHEVSATMNVPLKNRAGFYNFTEDNYASKMFTGQRFSHTLKYRYHYRTNVKYGATVQEDVGERFGAYGGKPWDYGSAYFYFKSPNYGRKTRHPFEIALGDYKLSLGEGLVIGETSWGETLGATTGSVHLRPNTGTDESRFLRGAASHFFFGKNDHWSITAFASWRQLDGTVKGMKSANDYDKEASDTITAWKTDGLHRTLQEIHKRHVATQLLGGGRLGFQNSWMDVGLNGVYVHFDKIYWPASRKYNQYYLRGDEAAAMSVDYSFKYKRWSLQGELALDPTKNVQPQTVEDYHKTIAYAEKTAFRWRPLSYLSLYAIGRLYAKDFVSPYHYGTQLQNEMGILLGCRAMISQRLEFVGYGDYSYRSQPSYSADTCATKITVQAEGIFRQNGEWQHTLRYKLQTKQQNVPDYDETLLEWCTQQHLRWQSKWSRASLSIAFGGDFALYHTQIANDSVKAYSKGGMLYVRATDTFWDRLKVSVFLGGFLSDNYYTRCYAYMPQLRGSISIPSFYGKGLCADVVAEGRIWKKLYLSALWDITKYFDRDTISSGVNEIKSSWKGDVAVQLRMEF